MEFDATNKKENYRGETFIELEGDSHRYQFTLSDLALLKKLIDRERFNMIQTYGEEVKTMDQYKQFIYLKRMIRGMIDSLMDHEWEELDKESKYVDNNSR